MSQNIVKNFYRLVGAGTSQSDDYIIPAGKSFYLGKVSLDAAMTPEVNVNISFGSEVIVATHGSISEREIRDTFIGDGEKSFKITLSNTSASDETIGARYEGVEY